MRAKLTDLSSIPGVIRDMTLDEKLNLVGEYSACRTLAIPDMNIPSLCLMDGATGVNGIQGLSDYITSREMADYPEISKRMFAQIPELIALNYADLNEAQKKHSDDPHMLNLIDSMGKMRPNGKQHISFPSGITIGATFDTDMTYRIGAAVGEELRATGVDVMLGPNVDLIRDPLSGRGYEMYGEDPYLVAQTSAAFIRGVQSAGTAACAKHFLANNQETNRNTKNIHVSERALHEIYGRGFEAAIHEADVKMIMSAYNAINGEFTSYSKTLLKGWLKDEWKFEGVVCCDWGAVKTEKEKSLEAGMDLILCGPSDMNDVKEHLEKEMFSMKILDESVRRILKLIIELREVRARKAFVYQPQQLLQTACEVVMDGSVLLKNNKQVLPLDIKSHIAVYGRRSKEMMECGTGSTSVISGLHSNVYDECGKHFEKVSFEDMKDADTVIYTVAAFAGENIDRSEMDIDREDREKLIEVLLTAKEKGLKTIVVLNISGPIDMRRWINLADAVLTVFIPGCMGGVAIGKMLCGEGCPGGKLPVTFPVAYEDTPSYPNFPGEYNDVYYGEGIFVGYRYYEKKNAPVLFPFGYGMSYTAFETKALQDRFILNGECENSISVPIKVKNTGNYFGSEVIQIYAAEKKAHVLRPKKELVGFSKVKLYPGEIKIINVIIRKKDLQYFDLKKNAWVLPVGEIKLWMGTSTADIFAEGNLTILGKDRYILTGESTVGEILKNEAAVNLVEEFTGGLLTDMGEGYRAFAVDKKLDELLKMVMITRVPDSVRLNSMLQELYGKLKKL